MADLADLVAQTRQDIDRVVAAGGTAYLTTAVHLPVDSPLDPVQAPPAAPGAGMPLQELAALGARGWEVVAVVPRTAPSVLPFEELSKMTWRDWGGEKVRTVLPFGANVVGAYVLLRLPITAATRALHEGEIEPACARLLG